MPTSSRHKSRSQSVLDFVLPDLKPGEISVDEVAQAVEQAQPQIAEARLVALERLSENPDNPRQGMSEGPLRELASSIAERGLLQPLVVRRDPLRAGHYIVIAGSRRLLAARLVYGDHDEMVRARVAQLPCIIRGLDDRDAFADALMENLARKDLTRVEMMDAVLRLHQDYGWSAGYMARRTGRNQHDLSELLRVALDPALSALVKQDIIKPTVAGEVTRLPQEIRDAVISDLQAGTLKTVADVKRRRADARQAKDEELQRDGERTTSAGEPAAADHVATRQARASVASGTAIGFPEGATEPSDITWFRAGAIDPLVTQPAAAPREAPKVDVTSQDDVVSERVVMVAAHERRLVDHDLDWATEVERATARIVTLLGARKNPDRASLRKLEELSVHIAAYLASHEIK